MTRQSYSFTRQMKTIKKSNRPEKNRVNSGRRARREKKTKQYFFSRSTTEGRRSRIAKRIGRTDENIRELKNKRKEKNFFYSLAGRRMERGDPVC